MKRVSKTFKCTRRIGNAGMVVVSCVLTLISLEFVLRITVDYHIDYYASKHETGPTILHFPYGELPINSLGEPDSEFDLRSSKQRIGYFGDSVNLGVGAGYPHRFSELVENAFPEYEHWNVASRVGTGIPLQVPDKVRRYGLRYAVYLLNLNDISPAARQGNRPRSNITHMHRWVRHSVDWLRDKSYLYNYVRFKIKNAVSIWLGFDATGYKAYELWPLENAQIFAAAVARINSLAARTKLAGAELCIVLLPYEMQVSRPAALVYRELGFRWGRGLLEGAPQSLIKKGLSADISVHDPLQSFAPFDTSVGTYFVFDKGDKIDWNHPNRAGHRALADSFLASRDCPFLVKKRFKLSRRQLSCARARRSLTSRINVDR